MSGTVYRSICVVGALLFGVAGAIATDACADPYLDAQVSCVERYNTRAQIDTCRAAARLPFADASSALNSAALPHAPIGDAEARILADMAASAKRSVALAEAGVRSGQ
jgi:hypothetical protein